MPEKIIVNYYGLFVLFLFIFLGIFTKWIYGLNLKIKYSQKTLRINNNSAYEIKNFFKQKIIFNEDSNFFKLEFNKPKNLVRFHKEYLNKSIFGYVNGILLFSKIQVYKWNNWLIEYWCKIIQFFLTINLIWILILGFWYVLIFVITLNLILLLIELFLNYKVYFITYQFCLNFLKLHLNEVDYLQIKKYVKYKKLYFLTKYITIFIEPWIEMLISLKELSTDE